MGYIEDNLMSGEEVIYHANLHWIVFIRPIIWLVIAVIFFASGSDVAVFGGIFIIATIVDGINSIIVFKTSEFGVTNKRVMVKVGFIRRHSLETLLNKVEGIQVNQDILGRILGYGAITVTGTGGTKDPFHKITNPLEFRKKVQEQISITQDSK